MSDNTEQVREWVKRAQAGEREAYGELVRLYQRRVFITALQITHNEADAEDLSQEVFVRAFRALPGFQWRSDLFTWLYRITVNTALNFLASAHRRRSVSLDDERLAPAAVERLMADSEDPRRRLELRQLYRQVLVAMETLKPELQVALVLHTLQGLTHKEVAAIMECAEGTVAWRISEARRLLRIKLRRSLASDNADDGLSDDKKEPLGLP